VRCRGLLPLLATALAACGSADAPVPEEEEEVGRTQTEPPGAAVKDQAKREARALSRFAPRIPPPGTWVGQTTQGRDARLQVLPGGRVHFQISTSLPCPNGTAIPARSFPDKLPVLEHDGSFAYQEAGDGRGLDYTMRVAGQVGPEFASGTFKGTASRADGRTCAGQARWTAARLERSGD
jgi:hypothetical protein